MKRMFSCCDTLSGIERKRSSLQSVTVVLSLLNSSSGSPILVTALSLRCFLLPGQFRLSLLSLPKIRLHLGYLLGTQYRFRGWSISDVGGEQPRILEVWFADIGEASGLSCGQEDWN